MIYRSLLFMMFTGIFLPDVFAQEDSPLAIELYSLQDSVSDVGKFRVVMKNVGDQAIAVIPLPCQLYFNWYLWFIKFRINDEEKGYMPHIKLNHGLDKKQYKMIEPNQSYEFDFTINFQELGTGRVENRYDFIIDYTPTYGKYMIQIYYMDHFKKHKKYVKGKVYSNDVTVLYYDKLAR